MLCGGVFKAGTCRRSKPDRGLSEGGSFRFFARFVIRDRPRLDECVYGCFFSYSIDSILRLLSDVCCVCLNKLESYSEILEKILKVRWYSKMY